MDILITLHSYNRYLVVFVLLLTIGHFSYKFWKKAAPAPLDRALAGANLGFAHLQLILGLLVYFIGGRYQNIDMSDKASRYWGMEHFLMMLIAVVLITLSVAATKRIQDDNKRYFRIFLYNTLAFLVIAIGLSYGVAPGLFGSIAR